MIIAYWHIALVVVAKVSVFNIMTPDTVIIYNAVKIAKAKIGSRCPANDVNSLDALT